MAPKKRVAGDLTSPRRSVQKRGKSGPDARPKVPTKAVVQREILTDPRPTTGDRSASDDVVCGACLLAIAPDSDVGLVDRCSHIFHHRCILRWSERENSCPQCKFRFSWMAAYAPDGKRLSLNKVKKLDQTEVDSNDISDDGLVVVDDENDEDADGFDRELRQALAVSEADGVRPTVDYAVDVNASESDGGDAELEMALAASRTESVLNIDSMPASQEVARLSAATGRSNDECMAALLQKCGSHEEAALLLLTNVKGGGVVAVQEQVVRGCDEAAALQLTEITCRGLAACVDALRACGGDVEAAAGVLLAAASVPMEDVSADDT